MNLINTINQLEMQISIIEKEIEQIEQTTNINNKQIDINNYIRKLRVLQTALAINKKLNNQLNNPHLYIDDVYDTEDIKDEKGDKI